MRSGHCPVASSSAYGKDSSGSIKSGEFFTEYLSATQGELCSTELIYPYM